MSSIGKAIGPLVNIALLLFFAVLIFAIIAVVVHADDFTALGKAEDLNWYEHQLAELFELKIRGRMGSNTDCKVMRIRHRIVTMTEHALTYEAEP